MNRGWFAYSIHRHPPAPAWHTTPTHLTHGAYKTGRGMFPKSHISVSPVADRLRIEAAYPL